MKMKKNSSSLHQIKEIIPLIFQEICHRYEDRPDAILSAWPEIIGPHFHPQTEPLSFVDGVLFVRVKNSTLYSLLVQYEKTRLLRRLQERFPKTAIKAIRFQIR